SPLDGASGARAADRPSSHTSHRPPAADRREPRLVVGRLPRPRATACAAAAGAPPHGDDLRRARAVSLARLDGGSRDGSIFRVVGGPCRRRPRAPAVRPSRGRGRLLPAGADLAVPPPPARLRTRRRALRQPPRSGRSAGGAAPGAAEPRGGYGLRRRRSVAARA